MRILIATNYQPPHMGGIEFAAQCLEKCWLEMGHEVTWVTTDIPKGARPSAEHNVRIPAFNFLEDWLELNTPIVSPLAKPDLRKLVASHDVINVHSMAPCLTTAILNEALAQKKPTVVTQHVGIIPMKGKIREWAQRLFLLRKARHALRGGSLFTFVGKAVRDWFSERVPLPAESVFMTPAGIDHDDYRFVTRDRRRAYRAKWDIEDELLNVLFVGRFYEKKGLPLLKQVAQRCPNVQFTFVGSGNEDPSDWHFPNVRVISYVPTEELRELYGSHDLLILPSVGEGWPAVVPQAMACGLPCLISEETFSGYGKNPDRFLICTRDADVIAGTLEQAEAGNVPLMSQRMELSEYAMAEWDWSRTAKTYIELFDKAMGQRSKSPTMSDTK